LPKPCAAAYICKTSTGDVEAEGLETQGHPSLHTNFVASLCYRRLFGKKKSRKKKETTTKNSNKILHLLEVIALRIREIVSF